jgi:hypothetical protein
VTADEYLELLAYLRDRLRDAGLVDLDDTLAAGLRGDEQASPYGSVIDYLDALDAQLALRSRGTVEATVSRLNEIATAEGRIETITVELAADEQQISGRDELDLMDLPDLQPIREELTALLGFLRDELERL